MQVTSAVVCMSPGVVSTTCEWMDERTKRFRLRGRFGRKMVREGGHGEGCGGKIITRTPSRSMVLQDWTMQSRLPLPSKCQLPGKLETLRFDVGPVRDSRPTGKLAFQT